MGDAAEMILEGYQCPCGELLVYPGDEPAGHVDYCSSTCRKLYGGLTIEKEEFSVIEAGPDDGCWRKGKEP